jgi:hypothetical protein
MHMQRGFIIPISIAHIQKQLVVGLLSAVALSRAMNLGAAVLSAVQGDVHENCSRCSRWLIRLFIIYLSASAAAAGSVCVD